MKARARHLAAISSRIDFEARKSADFFFRLADTNKDGRISFEEFHAAYRTVYPSGEVSPYQKSCFFRFVLSLTAYRSSRFMYGLSSCWHC